MSQSLNPLDGGRSQIQFSSNYKPGTFLSRQYVSAKKLEPAPTEWADGRPIYDRLPSASEQYKLYFGLDNDSAYVYVPVGNPYAGPGSLQVVKSGENKFLAIQGGSVVWEHGNIELDPVILDLRLLDMRNAEYLLAYQLYFDDSPFEAQYSVSDFSLSGLEMNVGSGTDSESGWRYKPEFAFSNIESQAWRNYDGVFPNYNGQAYLIWQTEYPNEYSKIKLRCPSNTAITGSATLYYQTCPSPNPNDKYCSSPEWLPQNTVEVTRDSEGQYFEFDITYPSPQYGWKVVWSDAQVSIKSVLVSGSITLKRRPATGSTYCQLVAYPRNSAPKTITNSVGIEVPVVYCNLANVDINNLCEVTQLSDIRQTVGTNYQPIADWLTKPWDDNLSNLYKQIKNYPEYWMAPSTCMDQEYASLEQSLIQVEK